MICPPCYCRSPQCQWIPIACAPSTNGQTLHITCTNHTITTAWGLIGVHDATTFVGRLNLRSKWRKWVVSVVSYAVMSKGLSCQQKIIAINNCRRIKSTIHSRARLIWQQTKPNIVNTVIYPQQEQDNSSILKLRRMRTKGTTKLNVSINMIKEICCKKISFLW